MVSFSALVRWIQQGGPSAAKHRTWHHSAVSCLLHYALVTSAAIFAHDAMLEYLYDKERLQECAYRKDTTRISSSDHYEIPCVVLAYSIWLFVWRLHHAELKPLILYEYTWLCNVTLVVGSISLIFLKRPLLATAHCVAVSIDQVMWYCDIVGYWLTSKFPIGVCKYLTWPETTFSTRISSLHHLWTIPVLTYCSGGLHGLAFPLSIVIVVLNVLVSRFLTPHSVESLPNKRKYLNVNLAHELWKDVKLWFLQISEDDPPVFTYLFRLLWRWQVLNFGVFLGLHAVSMYWLGPAPVC